MKSIELSFLGASQYLDAHPELREDEARIYVKFRPDGVDSDQYFLALLDTGAHYCILNRDVADAVREHLSGRLERVKLRTAHGLLQGELFKHTISLIADLGEPLHVDATVFVPDDWPGPSFLGYLGLLERVVFALDPPKNLFFFASPG